MARSSAAISAADLAYMAADKPIIAASVMPASPTLVNWSHEGLHDSTAHPDTTYPYRRAYDGLVHLDTRPAVAEAATTWYLYVNFGALVTFDAVALIGHNFGTLTLTAVQIQSADDGDFGASIKTIADFGTPTTDDRLIDLNLADGGDSNRRETTQFCRLKLTNDAAFTPQLGEILFLRRRQLPRKFEYPYDSATLVDSIEVAESQSGVSQAVEFYARRKHLEGRMVLESSAERDDLLAWHRQAGRQFVWIEDPTTYPNNWSLMNRPDPRANIILEEYGKYIFELTADEQGPERFFLDNE